MMTAHQKGLVYGALLADAFALGSHWIYDTDQIAKSFAPLTDLTSPAAPYHIGKSKGDFTHYGDQTLFLLEYIADKKKLDINDFKSAWLSFVSTHKMYIDHATKASIELLSDSDNILGSTSNELGGFVRSSSLFALDYVTLDDVLAQTKLTHTDLSLEAIAVFTYKLLKQILSGKTPSEALDIIYEKAPTLIKQQVDLALSLLKEDTVSTIKSIGQSCSSEYGFPAAIYLIFKYEDDFEQALIQNTYAGGDSAARGMYVGMVLGAYAGYDKLPSQWIDGISAKERIDAALKHLALI